MALKKNDLEAAILAAFKKAKSTPAPSDPKKANEVQEQVNAQLAQDLANAIDAFMRGGDVVQVKVDVVSDPGGVEIGKGTQTGVGKVQ